MSNSPQSGPWEKYAAQSAPGPWEKYANPNPDLTAQNAVIDKMQADASNPTFSQRFVETMGIPTSLDEAKEMGKEVLKNAATGGVYGAYQATKGAAKGIYEGGKEVGNALIAQDQGKGSTVENLANAAHGVAHGVAQSIPFVGSAGEQVVSDASKGNVGAAAGTLTALGLQGAAFHAAGAEKGAADTETPVKKGYENLIQSISSGRNPEFPDTVQRLAENGHLREWAQTYEPQTVKEGADTLREYKHDWEKKTIEPAVARSPGVTISGDKIAADVSSLKNPILDKIFTDNPKIVNAEAERYAGQDIPLSEVFGPDKLLAKLNAMTKAVEKMSPENKAAAENISSAKAAIDKVASSVREQAYGKLADLGDPAMADVQRDYGAMQELQQVLDKNVSRAELAEAKKPGYKGVPLRAMTRHPLLAGSMAFGAEYLGNPLPLAALPAIEALETYRARASTPNAMFRKAMNNFSNGPELSVPQPLPRRLDAGTSGQADQSGTIPSWQRGMPQSWADPRLRMLYGKEQPALPPADYSSRPGDIPFDRGPRNISPTGSPLVRSVAEPAFQAPASPASNSVRIQDAQGLALEVPAEEINKVLTPEQIMKLKRKSFPLTGDASAIPITPIEPMTHPIEVGASGQPQSLAKHTVQEMLKKSGFERNEQGKYVRVKANVPRETPTLPPNTPTEPLARPEPSSPLGGKKIEAGTVTPPVPKVGDEKVWRSDAEVAAPFEESVREKIRSAPSYPKLLDAYKRSMRSLHGKGDSYTENRIKQTESEPENLLSAHSGIMNAKSARAQTLKSLADAVFRETGLPRQSAGKFRGEDYRIDWRKIEKGSK